MSLKSWKEEFYSVPAHAVRIKDTGKHVLLKWKGLTRKNLRRHGLRKVSNTSIRDDIHGFQIHESSCAWCKIAKNRSRKHPGFKLCDWCPAVEAGMTTCTRRAGWNCEDSPWGYFANKGRIKEMLTWIKIAIKMIEKKEKK